MKEAMYSRNGRVITTIETGAKEHFEFINEAKRKSHELQISEDGTLGRGSVIVEV